MIFNYRGKLYPEYIRNGNACRFITPFAQQFCTGSGVDVGPGKWPFPGALPVDVGPEYSAMELPPGPFDYVFSSHCLEHLRDPIGALEHWRERLRPGGVLFLYLPHPDMEYWQPQNCRKHLHSWRPGDMKRILYDLGFCDVLASERDLAWSFAVVGFKGPRHQEPAA